MEPTVKEKAGPSDPLPVSSRLLRYPLTPKVAYCHENLDPLNVRIREGQLRYRPDRSWRDAMARGGRAHPVSEIPESVERAELADPAAPKEALSLGDDDELVLRAVLVRLDLVCDPCASVLDPVVGMAPGKPWEDLRS